MCEHFFMEMDFAKLTQVFVTNKKGKIQEITLYRFAMFTSSSNGLGLPETSRSPT